MAASRDGRTTIHLSQTSKTSSTVCEKSLRQNDSWHAAPATSAVPPSLPPGHPPGAMIANGTNREREVEPPTLTASEACVGSTGPAIDRLELVKRGASQE